VFVVDARARFTSGWVGVSIVYDLYLSLVVSDAWLALSLDLITFGVFSSRTFSFVLVSERFMKVMMDRGWMDGIWKRQRAPRLG